MPWFLSTHGAPSHLGPSTCGCFCCTAACHSLISRNSCPIKRNVRRSEDSLTPPVNTLCQQEILNITKKKKRFLKDLNWRKTLLDITKRFYYNCQVVFNMNQYIGILQKWPWNQFLRQQTRRPGSSEAFAWSENGRFRFNREGDRKCFTSNQRYKYRRNIFETN